MTEQPTPPLLDKPYEMRKARARVIDTDGSQVIEVTHLTLGFSPWIALVVDSVENGYPHFAVMWGGMESAEAQQAIRALAASLPPEPEEAEEGTGS